VDLREGRKEQGASTLSMQLARNIWLQPEKSWRRKMAEMLITMHLEHKLSKQEIFEYYANQVYLGRHSTFSINGFGEASRAYFGKDVGQLNLPQAALLAGMVQRPSYYNPLRYPDRARERRNIVMALMRENGFINEAQYRQAADAPLQLSPAGDGDSVSAQYFVDLVNDELQSRLPDREVRGNRAYTTLDLALQRAAEEAVRSGMPLVDQQLKRRRKKESFPPNQPQVALIALDPHTGAIKALVGGRDYRTSQLDHVLAQRQPGSAFKPFVYAAALNTAVEGGEKIFTPASPVTHPLHLSSAICCTRRAIFTVSSWVRCRCAPRWRTRSMWPPSGWRKPSVTERWLTSRSAPASRARGPRHRWPWDHTRPLRCR
jgi:penicillin-binding protein 1B